MLAAMKNKSLFLLVAVSISFIIPHFSWGHEAVESFRPVEKREVQSATPAPSRPSDGGGSSRVKIKPSGLTASLARPLGVDPVLGTPVTLTGVLEVTHFDDFDNTAESYFHYELKQDNGARVTLELAGNLAWPSGTRVQVSGYRAANTLWVSQPEDQSLVHLDPLPLPESVGEQETLVLLVKFTDSGPAVFDLATAEQLVFASTTAAFFEEQSAGRVSFDGEVRGWYTLPRPGLVNGSCVRPTLGHDGLAPGELDNILLEDGIDFSRYDRVVILVQHPCFLGGWSSIGKNNILIGENTYRFSLSAVGNLADYTDQYSEMPFSWTNFDHILSHELGHGLGLVHASGWNCGNQTLYGNCEVIEYGNPFDTMGTGAFATHFNAFSKTYLNWLTGNEVLNITQSGRYVLKTLEGSSGSRAAKISFPNSSGVTPPPFYLEYRRGVGFDSKLDDSGFEPNQHGLFINRVIQPFLSIPNPRLLDLTPNTSNSWSFDSRQVTLNVGATPFVDEGLGLTIGPVISSGEGGIIFDVTLNPGTCTSALPTMQVNSSSEVAVTGVGAVILTVTNQDSVNCADSTFTLDFDLPENWETLYSQAGTFTLEPQQTVTKVLTFGVPASIIPGPYELAARVTHDQTGAVNEQVRSVWALPTPVINQISPSSATPGTTVEITGQYFNPGSYNSISLSQGTYYASKVVFADPEGTSLLFTIPTLINNSACDCQVPTPPGTYDVNVYVYGTVTNSLPFQVLP